MPHTGNQVSVWSSYRFIGTFSQRILWRKLALWRNGEGTTNETVAVSAVELFKSNQTETWHSERNDVRHMRGIIALLSALKLTTICGILIVTYCLRSDILLMLLSPRQENRWGDWQVYLNTSKVDGGGRKIEEGNQLWEPRCFALSGGW